MATATLAFDSFASRVAALRSRWWVFAGARNLVERSLDPDTASIARCLAGDETAWEELVRLHTRQVYGLCYRFTGAGRKPRT